MRAHPNLLITVFLLQCLTSLEAGVLLVMGVAQIALARLCHASADLDPVDLAGQMCALLRRGLGLTDAEAQTIGHQAAVEIVAAP